MSSGRMTVRNKTGHVITLDEGLKTITFADESGDQIVFDAKNRTLTVEVKQDLSITVSSGKVTINAPSGVTIQSNDLVLGSSSNPLKLVNESMIAFFNNHKHTDGQGLSTSTPTSAATVAGLCTSKTRGA